MGSGGSEAGEAEGISRTDGRKAAALLATRGLTMDERTRLQGLVDAALGPAEPLGLANRRRPKQAPAPAPEPIAGV